MFGITAVRVIDVVTSGPLVVRDQDTAKHSAMHKTAPNSKVLSGQ